MRAAYIVRVKKFGAEGCRATRLKTSGYLFVNEHVHPEMNVPSVTALRKAVSLLDIPFRSSGFKRAFIVLISLTASWQ